MRVPKTVFVASVAALALALGGTDPAGAECNTGVPPAPVDPDPEGSGPTTSGNPAGETGGGPRTPTPPPGSGGGGGTPTPDPASGGGGVPPTTSPGGGGGTPTPPPDSTGGGVPPTGGSGGRGGTPTPGSGGKSANMSEGGLEHWDDWWNVHQDRYLAVRRRAREADRLVATVPETPAAGAPAGDPRAEAREFLLAAFRDPRWSVRATAAIALGRSGTIAALPEFTRMERARVRDVRGSAAVGAGLLGDPLVVDDLARTVFDPGEIEHLRGVTIVALGLIGGPEASRALRAFLDPSADALRVGGIARTQMLEETAVAALGLARCPESIPFLRKVLASGTRSDRTRAFAATSLARLGDREGIPLLLQALGADEEILRQSGAVALGVVCTPADAAAVADLVRAAREDRDASTRRFSALALGRIGGPEARAALVALLGKGRAPDLPFTAVALGTGGVAEAGPALAALFRETKDPEVRSALAISLGLLRWTDSAPDLMAAALSRGNHHLRGDCFVALGLLGHREAAAPAKEILEAGHTDEGLLADAATCLALLGDRRPLALLPRILREGRDHVHGMAAYRILGLAGDAGSLPELAAAGRDRRLDDRSRCQAVETVGALLDANDVPVLSTIAMDSPFLLFRGPLEAVVGHR